MKTHLFGGWRRFLVGLLLASSLHGQETPSDSVEADIPEWVVWENVGESEHFQSVELLFAQIGEEYPVGILLVVGPQDRFSDLEGLKNWHRFSRRSGRSLAILAFDSEDPSRSDEEAAGLWLQQQAQREVGKKLSALAQAQENPSATSVPWNLYLVDSGVDLMLSAILTERINVEAWVAQGGSRYPDVAKLPPVDSESSPQSRSLPPGLVIGGAGKNREGWECVHHLRQRDPRAPLAFQAHQGHVVDEGYFQELGNAFLQAAVGAEPDTSRWVNYETGEHLTEELLETISGREMARFHWFPNDEFLGAWTALSENRPSEPEYVVPMFTRSFEKPPSYFSKVEFHHNRLGKEPKAIFLIALDSNRPQAVFQDQKWIDFARREGLSLMVVNVKNGTRIRSDNRAAAWLGDRLFDFIDKGAYKDVAGIPVIWYGAGRPAYWMQRIMMERLDRFAAWSTMGTPEFAVVPSGTALPPGLIIAAHPGQHFPSLFFMQDVRKSHQANRVCLIAKDDSHINGQYIEEFAREFLAGATTRRKGKGFWLRFRDDKLLTLASSQQGVDPADYVWLPSPAVAGTWKLLSRTRPQIPFPTIKKFTIETPLQEQPELNLFIRIPGGESKDKKPEVKGVLCFCTWQQEDTSLLNRLKKPDDPLVAFADRNQLAVITWNTAGMLPPGTNINGLDEVAEQELARKFDLIGETWLKGIEKVCRENKLPDKGFLLHGVSRGSTYAHRLALRHPEKFLAVNTHIASHYEDPHEDATDVIWLITTGEIDGGYRASREFFLKAQELGFPTLIKAGPSLGHSMRDDIELLSLTFFDYVLRLDESAAAKRADPQADGDAKMTAAQLFRERVATAQYFGDFINHEVYPKSEGDWVPEGQRIPLPSEELANAWGAEPEKGL